MKIVTLVTRKRFLERYPDGLHVGVLFQGVAAQIPAEAALFVAAERRSRIEGVVGIDPDATGSDLRRHAVGQFEVARPDGGGQAIGGAVGDAYGIVRVAKADGADDR